MTTGPVLVADIGGAHAAIRQIESLFLSSEFVDRFVDTGRLRDYLQAVPVDLIMRNDVALRGAAEMLRDRRIADGDSDR